MATVVPIDSRYMDNLYMETMKKIQPFVQDQVLEATVVTKLLKDKGCVKPQVGGNKITRGVLYDYQDSTEIEQGDLLPAGTKELATQYEWTWRIRATHVQQDDIENAQNAGEFQVADAVQRRLTAALDGFGQNQETDLLRAHVAAETGKFMQGLNDLIPPVATRNTGTWGGIARPTSFSQVGSTGVYEPATTVDNWWNTPRYMLFTGALEVVLASNFRTFYNVVGNQQENPDVILTTQAIYELYEEFGLDAVQVMHNSEMLNLGFSVLKYKAADLTYSPNVAAGSAMFLNTRHIEWIYNPLMWFQMTAFKQAPRETRRIAHILAMCNMITNQPRRHGLLSVS